MRKLIDQFIKTIKKDNLYYTFCTLWDDPENDNKPFPNEAVGVGTTKQESIDKFTKHEEERQHLLNKCYNNIKELKEKGIIR